MQHAAVLLPTRHFQSDRERRHRFFRVKAGVDFSTIEKHEFAIQASPVTPPPTGTPPATATVNKFVLTNNSRFHPLPLGMIHARLCEFNVRFALHLNAFAFEIRRVGRSCLEEGPLKLGIPTLGYLSPSTAWPR